MRVAQLSIAVLLLSLISTATAEAEVAIQWLTDLESAKRTAAETNRPILVHFWSPVCAPCVRLDQEVFARPDVKREMERMFVLVKLNVENEPGTALLYGVRSWPADVILAPDGTFVAQLKCPPVAGQYLARLAQVVRAGNPPAGAALANVNPAASGAAGQAISNAPAVTNVQPQRAAPATAQVAPPTSQYAAAGTTSRIEQYDWSNPGAASRAAGRGIGSAYQPTSSQPYGGSTLPGSQPPSVSAASYNSIDSQQPLTPHYQQPPSLAQFDMVPAKSAPPLGLDGFCPVRLGKPQDKRQALWVKGDPRFGVVHRGRTYLFSSPEAQQEFLREPDRYSPVMAGNDPVLLVEDGQQVPGTRRLGLFFGDRVYLFANEQSRAKFQTDMRKYAEVIYQAENPGRGIVR
ncbi:MAG: thioredoxin family protein [Pirellulales bacterium]